MDTTVSLCYNRKVQSLETRQRTRGSLSRDILTWPNLVSVAGCWLVHHGSQRMTTLQGLTEVAVGRGLDIADGAIARATGQETDFGAAVDASLDKLGMARILWAAWRTKAVPRPILTTLAALNILNSTASVIASARHPEASYRTPLSGKLSMALSNVALLSHLIASTTEQTSSEHQPTRPRRGTWLRRIGTAAFAASLPLAAHAARHYIRRTFRP